MKQLKRLLYLLVFAFSGIFADQHIVDYDPLLVVVLMVKDEATVMVPTLEPYIKAGITHFFIFDTGSTDDTIEVTHDFFIQNNITTFVIQQEPFVDFATSRNRALTLAEHHFPQACFMLMPDAEWYLVNGEKLLEYCEQEKNKKFPSYMIRILHPGMDFYTQRLLRVDQHCRFAGVVHESIDKVTLEKVPADVFFDLRVSHKGAQKTARRWLRDKDLLLKDYQDHPENPRTCFYLAQTFECLGDLENAALYYRKRTVLAGWDEENYMTWYRLGGVLEQMAGANEEEWMCALHAYLKAYSMRPCRVEPLIKIARYYISKGQHALAYLFCARACQAAYPSNDVLFVEKALYDYTRHDILGQCSWYVGEYEVGEDAVREALKTQPEMPHLLRNLAFYLDKKVAFQTAM